MSARILVVDDLEANRRLLEAKLTAEYYDVLTASRGEEAVQLAKRERPDLILLDVMMPGGIDGFEACRRLKAQPETRHIPWARATSADSFIPLADAANLVLVQEDEILAKAKTLL